jgi:predicted amidohydrolase
MMDERFLFRSARCVGTLNLGPTPADVAGNLLMAEKEIRAAKALHPELRWLLLPELFTCGYSALASVHRYAEDAHDGPSARFFASLAAELGLYVVYGFPERVPRGVCDSANLVGPEGVLLTYAKKHLVRETGEDLCFVPGDGPFVTEVDGLRVALAVC